MYKVIMIVREHLRPLLKEQHCLILASSIALKNKLHKAVSWEQQQQCNTHLVRAIAWLPLQQDEQLLRPLL